MPWRPAVAEAGRCAEGPLRLDLREAPGVAFSRFPHGVEHDARIQPHDLEQDERRSHRPAIPALPVPKRRDRKAEPSREFPLRETHALAERPHIEGQGRRFVFRVVGVIPAIGNTCRVVIGVIGNTCKVVIGVIRPAGITGIPAFRRAIGAAARSGPRCARPFSAVCIRLIQGITAAHEGIPWIRRLQTTFLGVPIVSIQRGSPRTAYHGISTPFQGGNAMCHGEEWEIYLMAQQREFERRKREKAEAENLKPTAGTTPTAPPRPAEAPSRNEEPVPV